MTHHCSSCGEPDISEGIRKLLAAWEESQKHPFGPELEGAADRAEAGDALVRLCGENPDVARTAWKLIAERCGGYFPRAAAVALLVAASTNLVPDVTAPEPL